jgi:hypothetical protein
MARPRLPLDEHAVLEAYAAGDSINAIALTLGVDRSRVTRVVDEAGVRRDDRGRHWAARRAIDEELLDRGEADPATRRRVVDARKHARYRQEASR